MEVANPASVAVMRVAETHIDRIMKVRQRYPIDAADLLSGVARRKKGLIDGVLRRDRNLPEEIQQQIGDVQAQLRDAIETVARRIEDREFQSVEQSIDAAVLAARERETATRLVQAHKQANISVRALQLTVSAFRDLNQYLVDRLVQSERDGDYRDERDLVLANAILVYEISDFVIRYIEDFEVWGLKQIDRIKKEMEYKMAAIEGQARKLRKDAQNPTINAAIREQTLAQVQRREQAVQRVRQEWNAFAGEIEDLKVVDKGLTSRLPTLRLIRDNAHSQIQLVDLLTVTSTVKIALDCFEAAITDVEDLDLIPITAERVERLLNVSV